MQQPKRIPGERNPEADSAAPMHVARGSWMNSEHGYGDSQSVIGRAIDALGAWRKRRQARRR